MSYRHNTSHTIIAQPGKKRKPLFINKLLNPGKYYPQKEAVTIIKRGYLYLTLFFTFLLGNHEGFIALWINDNPQPEAVFPYCVASLPPADQAAVNEGISIKSKAELICILEDYLS